MIAEAQPHLPVSDPEAPLVIHCPACQKSVAAPISMVGQLVECPFCQHQFIIQSRKSGSKNSGRESQVVQAELVSLEGQLRENTTQITELRGHVSRLNMELHRHQLRMTTLAERQTELQTGIVQAKGDRLPLDEHP